MKVLYEDNHLIAVAKKAGDIVQGDKTGDVPLSDLVKAYLKDKYQKPGNVYLGVVHRLDRPVSGIVLFAKTSKAREVVRRPRRAEDLPRHRRQPPSTTGRNAHTLAHAQREAKHRPRLRPRSARQQEGCARLSRGGSVGTLLLA